MKTSLSSLQKNFGWLRAVLGSKSVNKLVDHSQNFKSSCMHIHDSSVWSTSIYAKTTEFAANEQYHEVLKTHYDCPNRTEIKI